MSEEVLPQVTVRVDDGVVTVSSEDNDGQIDEWDMDQPTFKALCHLIQGTPDVQVERVRERIRRECDEQLRERDGHIAVQRWRADEAEKLVKHHFRVIESLAGQLNYSERHG